MIIFLVIVLGLVIGSFLNVVIFRLKNKESFIFGRSRCNKCHKALGALELIPVLSFIFLLGRCRHCREKISWQYPLVEISCALCFLALYLVFGLSWQFAFYLVITCFLIIIFVFDLRYYLILDRITIPAIIIALLANIFLKQSWLDLAIGLLAGGLFFALQFLISKGKWVGGGDIRLGVMMGALLLWQKLLLALFLAYLVGALVATFLLIFKKKKWKSEIPFGTFLAGAAFLVLIFGDWLINWYSSLNFYL